MKKKQEYIKCETALRRQPNKSRNCDAAKKESKMFGFTENYIKVSRDFCPEKINTIETVMLTSENICIDNYTTENGKDKFEMIPFSVSFLFLNDKSAVSIHTASRHVSGAFFTFRMTVRLEV